MSNSRTKHRLQIRTAKALVAALLFAAPPIASAQNSAASSEALRAPVLAIAEPYPVGVVRTSASAVDFGSDPRLSFGGPRTGTIGEIPAAATAARWSVNAPQTPARGANWFSPLASAVVPGAGQALLRQQRSLGYLVAETFLVLRMVQSKKDYIKARDRYRELAADVARASFGGARPVGPWEYYEEMEKNEASGVYSSGPVGVLIPETDVTTYNGKQWLLAREQFWANADVPPTDIKQYQLALDYYALRAVKDDYLWSWRDQTLALTEFRERIAESNSNNQRHLTAISLVAANHFVSLIDAYVTVRLRRYGGAGLQSASLTSKIVPMGQIGDRSYGMAMSVTIPVAGIR